MRQFFLFLFLLVSAQLFAGSKTETIEVDGIERSYIVYAPSTFDKSQSHSVLVVLHGLGGSAEGFADLFDAQALSDKFNSILLFPQALDEQNDKIMSAVELIKSTGAMPESVTFKNSWGAGARITMDTINKLAGMMAPLLPALIPDIVEKGYGELNESVDDVKFINSMLDKVDGTYNINDSIFVAGGSMGGAMTFKYAYSKDCRAMKVCSINGFVGGGVDTVGTSIKIPVLIFNSKSDAVVKYNGGMFNGPIDGMIRTIGEQNGCTSRFVTERVDLKDDGNEVFQFGYVCDLQTEVRCFISSNAEHQQFLNAKENDIDFLAEIEKFFYGRENTGCEDVTASELSFYPNPVENVLHCGYSGRCEVVDLMGRVVLSAEVVDGAVDLSSLTAGYYIFTLETQNQLFRARFVKK